MESVKIKTAAQLEGQRIPDVVFHTRRDGQWHAVGSREVFDGQTVVAFSLPGAFTPTCSSAHLPRYNELAQAFYARGVDKIVCLSVNDAFVMEAWLANQEAEHIGILPDGNGEFTAGMGMLVDKSAVGLGKRSWRYAMLVRDGVIEKLFAEPVKDGDPFEVSDADTMLRYLDPQWQPPKPVAVFTKPGCPFCAKAKALLAEHDTAYTEIVVGKDTTAAALRAVSGRTSVPQVFVGGRHIGGSEELAAYFAK